jgi:hypothetical protein
MKRTSFLLCCSLLTLLVTASIAQEGNTVTTTSLRQSNCDACDAPDMPDVGHNALRDSGGDAYLAVAILLPAAEAEDLDAQMAIAFIMQDWLNGHLKGKSNQPFSWRESWFWWHLVAYKSSYMANLLGGAYLAGAPSLPKNQKLGKCLSTHEVSGVSTRDHVARCFRQFAK